MDDKFKWGTAAYKKQLRQDISNASKIVELRDEIKKLESGEKSAKFTYKLPMKRGAPSLVKRIINEYEELLRHGKLSQSATQSEIQAAFKGAGRTYDLKTIRKALRAMSGGCENRE